MHRERGQRHHAPPKTRHRFSKKQVLVHVLFHVLFWQASKQDIKTRHPNKPCFGKTSIVFIKTMRFTLVKRTCSILGFRRPPTSLRLVEKSLYLSEKSLAQILWHALGPKGPANILALHMSVLVTTGDMSCVRAGQVCGLAAWPRPCRKTTARSLLSAPRWSSRSSLSPGHRRTSAFRTEPRRAATRRPRRQSPTVLP